MKAEIATDPGVCLGDAVAGPQVNLLSLDAPLLFAQDDLSGRWWKLRRDSAPAMLAALVLWSSHRRGQKPRVRHDEGRAGAGPPKR